MEISDEELEGQKFKVAVHFLTLGIIVGITICFIISTAMGWSTAIENYQSCLDHYQQLLNRSSFNPIPMMDIMDSTKGLNVTEGIPYS